MNVVKEMGPLTLAYVGDAVLELYVRKHLIAGGAVKPNDLHHMAVRYVSANAQAKVLYRLLDEKRLDQEETELVRRGRNAKSPSVPKNTAVKTYRYGTAFEALIGYHDLNGNKARVAEIIALMFRWIQEDEEGEADER